MSLELWRRHLSRRPKTNPVLRFHQRFEQDLPSIQAKGLGHYHAWAFGTIRQLGAAFELAALNLKWLTDNGVRGLETASAAFERISGANKTFILKGARVTNSKKAFDSTPMFEEMAQSWANGINALEAALQNERASG